MIRDVLGPALRERFASRTFTTDVPPNPIAVFSAAHSEVGDVSIWDDGDEATVSIGGISHGHYNPYDPSLSPEPVATVVTVRLLA